MARDNIRRRFAPSEFLRGQMSRDLRALLKWDNACRRKANACSFFMASVNVTGGSGDIYSNAAASTAKRLTITSTNVA